MAEIGGKMDTASTVRLPGWSDSVIRAAEWLRKHQNIPDYETLEREFAEYFRCRVVTNDGWNRVDHCAVFVEFDSESAVTMFVLKWSA